MKTIGILGGLGPEATADYYKEIIKGFNRVNKSGTLDYPEIIVYSVTMSRFIKLLEDKLYSQAVDYLVTCINRIKLAGAEFAVISANTPHLLFDEIQSKVELPLISIVEVCAQKAKSIGVKNCALFGTKFTMQNDFYSRIFKMNNIEIVVPPKTQIDFINSKLFNELELGIFKDETKQELLNIVKYLVDFQKIDSVILGCTEFPIMFQEAEYLGIPFLNTTQLHVEAIIKQSLNG